MTTNRLIASIQSVTLMTATHALSATIHVPGEVPTIAAALQLAHDGDIIELAPGTYTGEGNRDVLIDGLNVTVRGAAGSGLTIIDCEGSPRSAHRAFEVNALSFVLQGITIRNGWVLGSGGAVVATVIDDAGTYAFTDCVFEGCSANGFDPNDPSLGFGGAVTLSNANSVTVDHCRFTGNVAALDGGALLCGYAAVAQISNSTFEANVAGEFAALSVVGGDVQLDRCEFGHNEAWYAGAFMLNGFAATVKNCLVHNNVAVTYPSGSVHAWQTEIVYSTFVNNVSNDPEGFASSLFVYGGYLRGSILWDEGTWSGHALPLSSCIKGWSDTGYACTSADPLFVDPASEDYRLQATSPLIDYGGVSSVFVGEFDLDGNPREVDVLGVPNGPVTVADLGCFEVQLAPPSADLDGNGLIDAGDLALLLGAWGGACNACAADLNVDGTVDAADLATLLGSWG